MTTENIKKIIDLAYKLDAPLYMTNEDGRAMNLSDESTETFLDQNDDMLVSVRTNSNIGSQYNKPFSTTFIETDSIKMVTLELSLDQLKKVLSSRGLNENNNVKNIINIQSGIAPAKNFNVKYDETTDGDGNKVLKENISSTSSVRLGR